MSTNKKVVLVTGVTGAQGGSVARHLLSRGKFAVRGLTRNPESDKARALREAGVEIVRGDLDDATATLSETTNIGDGTTGGDILYVGGTLSIPAAHTVFSTYSATLTLTVTD